MADHEKEKGCYHEYDWWSNLMKKSFQVDVVPNLQVPAKNYSWTHVDNISNKKSCCPESKDKQVDSHCQVKSSGKDGKKVVFIDRLFAYGKKKCLNYSI